MTRRLFHTVVLTVPLLAILAVSCGDENVPHDLIPPEIPPATRGAGPLTTARNVLLITVDTLRADRLGCYGFTGAQTPAIDRLATEGVRFDNALVHAPITLPSHTSILSGTLPCAHGVHDNGIYRAGDDIRSLPEILKERGYATGAVIGAHVLDARYGLDQGFDTYDDDFVASRKLRRGLFIERQAEEIARHGMQWLSAQAGAGTGSGEDSSSPAPSTPHAPFFLWLHFFDPHMGYAPPEPFFSRFRHDLYSGEIAYTDQWIGQVLEHLESLPGSDGGTLASETIVVFTSDHGESLGEHGEETHAFFVYQSTIHVPLIIRCPGFPTRVVRETPAPSIDIVPTLLELLGIDAEPQMAGRSLVPALRGEPRPRLCYVETEMPLSRGWSPLRGLTNGRWKLIQAPESELYNLKADPQEQHNLYRRKRATARRLEQELERLLAAGAGENEKSRLRQTTLEEREMLKALGYVGGGRADRDENDLRDPKAMVHIYNAVQQAWGLSDAGRRKEAFEVLQRAIDNNPEYVEAHTTLGSIALDLDRNDDAIEAYRRALRLDPELILALNGAAAGLARQGKTAEALRLVERSLEIDGQNAKTFDTMANIYLTMGELERAWEICDQGLAVDPEAANLHNTLGMLRLARKEHEAALRAFQRALKIDSDFWLAAYNLGLACNRLERWHQALEAFECAKRLNPGDGRVHRALARAYYQSAIREMMEEPRDPEAARRKAREAEKLGYPVPKVFWLKLQAETGGR